MKKIFNFIRDSIKDILSFRRVTSIKIIAICDDQILAKDLNTNKLGLFFFADEDAQPTVIDNYYEAEYGYCNFDYEYEACVDGAIIAELICFVDGKWWAKIYEDGEIVSYSLISGLAANAKKRKIHSVMVSRGSYFKMPTFFIEN